MTTNWQSSPLRDKSGLDDVQNNQQNRARQMYRPMSSPIRGDGQVGAKSRIKKELENLRHSVREAKTELKREKKVHDEQVQKRIQDMEAQAAALTLDLDLLIEEENATVAVNGDMQLVTEYDEELEDYLAQEELELEAQLKELSIL